MSGQDLGKTSTGMPANAAALLSYLLGWVTGLVFFLLEKDNKFVRFHAVQSMVVFGTFTVIQFVMLAVPVVGWMLIPLLYLIQLVCWILLMIKAYQGEKFKLPFAGEIAEKNS